jgi:hypothetical protein
MKKNFDFAAVIFIGNIPIALQILNRLREDSETNRMFSENNGTEVYTYVGGPSLDNQFSVDIIEAFKSWNLICSRHSNSVLITSDPKNPHTNNPSFTWLYSNMSEVFGHGTACWDYPEDFREKYETIKGIGGYYIMMPRWEWRYHLNKEVLVNQTIGLLNAEAFE